VQAYLVELEMVELAEQFHLLPEQVLQELQGHSK
jgi:hypothetical protein